MDSKATAPYSDEEWCSYHKLFKIKHVSNAPYALLKGNNGNIHLYEIDKSRNHSFNKPKSYEDIWTHVSTINKELINWSHIDDVLYSQSQHLLWFISEKSDPGDVRKYYYFKLMGYSIANKQSLYIYIYLYLFHLLFIH